MTLVKVLSESSLKTIWTSIFQIDGGRSLVYSVDLCQFVIERSALVNVVDDTAFHSAILIRWLDTAHLLLGHGSDTSHCSNKGDDALQCAAVFRRTDILEQLVGKLKPTPQRWADAYS